MLGGRRRTASAYDDIIFGDHGAVVAERRRPERQPDPRLQKIQTTADRVGLRIRSRRRCRTATTTSIFGNLGRDVLVGGAGNDMIDGDEHDDLIFGDNVTSSGARRHHEPRFRT